jgi:hypothetical protein
MPASTVKRNFQIVLNTHKNSGEIPQAKDKSIYLILFVVFLSTLIAAVAEYARAIQEMPSI